MKNAAKRLALSQPKGFTLIELLVVIAIIGVLTGLVVTNISNPLAKGRDAQRRNDLKQLQEALEQYYQDHGAYPTTAGVCPNWCGEPSGFGSHTTDYIPGLAPKYIRKLPNDPRAGKPGSASTVAATGTCANSAYTGYLYISTTGQDYKLLAHCTPESPINNKNDPFYDPIRFNQSNNLGWAWQVSTDGYYNLW